MTQRLLVLEEVAREFRRGARFFGEARPTNLAVQGVTLSVSKGETLGIVGESGCGKSTIARMIVGLDIPTSGSIAFDGDKIPELARSKPRELARRVQLVFQDATSALNPRSTVRESLEAPMLHLLDLDREARQRELVRLMDAVRLDPDFLERYPHELSGGQAQRIGIARALAARPDLIVLDEPVSELDVSVQAQVLNILDDLKSSFGLTYIFISHDLSVIESICDRVAVMYFGHLVEIGTVNRVFRTPQHPYARLLLESVPKLGAKLSVALDTNVDLPDPFDPPPGCPFFERCRSRSEVCLRSMPEMRDMSPDQAVACHHPG